MRLFRLFLALAFLISFSAHAQRGGSSVDPFAMAAQDAYQDTKSTTIRSAQTLDSAVRNLVILIAGQSNIADYMPSAYSPANPTKIDNFNVFDGATYAAVDPLLGASKAASTTGNPILRLADKLITDNKFDRIVLVPLAHGSTTAADWATGFVSNKIQVALLRLAKRGMVSGTNITVIMLWGQGELDTTNGTSQASYTASLSAIITNARAAATIDRIFIASQSFNGSTTSANVTNAQAAPINHGTGIWAGASADTLTATACGGVACRQADTVHFSDAGSQYYAGTSGAVGWSQALAASGAPF